MTLVCLVADQIFASYEIKIKASGWIFLKFPLISQKFLLALKCSGDSAALSCADGEHLGMAVAPYLALSAWCWAFVKCWQGVTVDTDEPLQAGWRRTGFSSPGEDNGGSAVGPMRRIPG